jgi:DNA-binding LytR/AlgR family response regulator
MTTSSAVRILIAEDEQMLRQELARVVETLWPEATIVALAQNGTEALSMILQLRPDVAFLDIQMPGMTGIEVAKRSMGVCQVVFVTAYDQYAVDAFEAEAFDYILKPVTAARVGKAVTWLKSKFADAKSGQRDDDRLQKIIQILENRQTPSYLQLIRIKNGAEIVFVPVSEVLFFKADEKYTTVQTTRKSYLMNTPLKELETQLNPQTFWRVHRNAIINVERVQRVTRSLTNQMRVHFHEFNAEIPVSRTFEHLFKPSQP